MKKVKLLIMDVDGTLTDGKVYMSNKGELVKAFDIKDGYGIREIIIPQGIIPIVITGRKSIILEKRCNDLEIKYLYQGVIDKKRKLEEILNSTCCNCSEVAYIGDDLNDLPCMELIKRNNGFIGCPGDAIQKVKDIADYICLKNGGNGAVREFIDWLIA